MNSLNPPEVRSLELKSGDFLRHPRLGTVRVAEIGPDFISLRQKNGSAVRLSKAEADRQLRPVPLDGFYALVYQREPDAKWLRDNIEDVVYKLTRDRRSRSIDVEEIKRELSPTLDKQQHKWTSWWKAARKKLLSGTRFTSDPHRRSRLVLRSMETLKWSSEQIATRVRDMKDAREFLEMAKELDLYPASDRAQVAKRLADNTLARLRGVDVQSEEFPELFCAVCYAASFLEGSEVADLISRVPQTTLDRMCMPPGLEADLTFALSVHIKASSARWADLAKALLGHPSAEVAGKAFSALNAEANRNFLKKGLLSWITDPETAAVPRMELYLRKDFVKHLRQTDLNGLYSRLIDRPRLWEISSVRQFLNSPDIAKSVFNDERTDNAKKVAILFSNVVAPDIKLNLVNSEADPEVLLRVILSRLDPEAETAVAVCLIALVPAQESSSWEALLEVVRGGHHPRLFSGLTEYVKRSIKDASDHALLTLAKRGAQLYELAQEEYAESAEALAGALEEAGLRLFRLAGVPWASLLLRVFQSESEKSRSALTSENERLKRESADLSDKFQEALTEAGRLRDLAEMLKSSASVDKQELEAQIRIEAYRPVLLLVDDLERQATANSDLTIRHLISMLASALEHAGVRRVGTPGDVCGFDRDFHEFVEAPPQLEGTPDVRVLRSGFVLDTARGPRIIRRAAVRMP